MNIMTTVRRPTAGVELLTAAFDGLSDAVLVFDAEDRLALWNNRLRDVAPGLDEEIEVGMPMDDVGARLDAFDDGGLVRQCRRGPSNLLVLEVRRMSEGGRRERRLRHSERRWRDIAESLADWVWESDAHGHLTYLSEGFCRIVGESSCPSGVAQGCTRCLSGDGDGWARQLEAVPAATPFRDLRVKLRVNRIEHYFNVSGKPVFDFDGSFVGYRGTGCEITAQIRREEANEQARERQMSAIEYLTHGLALFDEADRLILCNERFRASFPQISDALAPGTPFIEITRKFGETWIDDPADLERWVSERMECHRLGLTHERRYPDGRWVLVKDMRLKDGSTVVTRTDITELKRREQAVRDSEARFRAVFQNAAIGIAVIQPGGRISQSNQAIEAMLGYSSLELAQLRYTDLVHPDHLEQESKLARDLIADQIDHYQMETRYIRNGGRVFWARVTVSIVRGDGLDRFAILMIEDIDKRKRAEAESSMFRAVVEASAEAIAILSPDGRQIFVNSAHERLFGSDAAAERVGYRHHYSDASQETLRREVIPALRRGDSWEGVLEARDASGRVFPLWQRAGVVRGATSRPKVYFAFMHDHTSQQQVQDELYKAKEAAEEANVAKTRFLAAASHDLRQPLQALSMFVEVLSNRNHNPQDAALIGRIGDSVNAVESLLNGLLDVSKLEAGLVVPVPTSFSLAPMFERLAGEFEPLVAAEGLELRVVRSRLMVKSDPALLERILRNLLSNAVRYTQTGRILFGCRRVGDKLRIEVWDTGIGIPASQLKAIFREFHQLGNPGRDRRQGLGLGLAIVERLARLLSHPITVHSEPNKGSMFSIDVPFALACEAGCEPRQLSLGISRRNAAIVVIDDEPDVLESTRLLLESWGHTVLTALDCESALQNLPTLGQLPDLILADYRLQNAATGGQAIARIRARLKTPVPAIILTGDTAPERLRQAKASGHGLLHKPVQPAALRQMIDELLARPSAVACR